MALQNKKKKKKCSLALIVLVFSSHFGPKNSSDRFSFFKKCAENAGSKQRCRGLRGGDQPAAWLARLPAVFTPLTPVCWDNRTTGQDLHVTLLAVRENEFGEIIFRISCSTPDREWTAQPSTGALLGTVSATVQISSLALKARGLIKILPMVWLLGFLIKFYTRSHLNPGKKLSFHLKVCKKKKQCHSCILNLAEKKKNCITLPPTLNLDILHTAVATLPVCQCQAQVKKKKKCTSEIYEILDERENYGELTISKLQCFMKLRGRWNRKRARAWWSEPRDINRTFNHYAI